MNFSVTQGGYSQLDAACCYASLQIKPNAKLTFSVLSFGFILTNLRAGVLQNSRNRPLQTDRQRVN